MSPSHTCQLSRFHRESHSLGHHLTVKFSNLTVNLHSNKIQTLNRSGFRGARGLIAASVKEMVIFNAKFRRPSGAFLFLENELSTFVRYFPKYGHSSSIHSKNSWINFYTGWLRMPPAKLLGKKFTLVGLNATQQRVGLLCNQLEYFFYPTV